MTIDMRHKQLIPFLFILGLWATLRAIYPTGIVFATDFEHARLADEFAGLLRPVLSAPFSTGDGALQAVVDFIQQHGAGRIMPYLPVSLFYLLFGVNDLSSLAYPLLSSLAGLAMVYGIASLVAGENAGLLAALLWVLLPAEIYYSTIMSSVLPFFMLNSAALFFFLLGERLDNRRRLVSYVVSAVCLLVSIIVNRAGWAVLIFFAAFKICAGKKDNRYCWLIGGGLVLLSWLAAGLYLFRDPAFVVQMPEILFGIYEYTAREPGWLLFLPLLVAGIAILAYGAERLTPLRPLSGMLREGRFARSPLQDGLFIPLLWLGTVYPVYSLYDHSGAGTEKFLLPGLAPVIILIAGYLSSSLNLRSLRTFVVIDALLTGLLVWLGSQAEIALVDLQPLSLRMVFNLSIIASGVAFFGSMSSPIFVLDGAKRWKTALNFLFLGLLGLAMLQPIQSRHDFAKLTSGNSSTNEAFAFLTSQEMVLPVYVDNQIMLERLNYLSGYRWGREGGIFQVPLTLLPEEPQAIGSAYVVLSSGSAVSPPESWWPVKQAGKSGHVTYWIYRALSPGDAAQELEAAKAAVRASPDGANYYRLSGAQINAGDLCEGYKSWMKSVRLGDFNYDFIPVRQGWDCFELGDYNYLVEHRWSTSLYSFGFIDRTVDAESGAPITRFVRKGYADRKTMFQTVFEVQPDTFYLLEMEVRGDSPIDMVTPYWKIGDHEMFLEAGGRYADWYHLGVLFITPPWEDPKGMLTAPFLFGGAHTAEFRNMTLREVMSNE